MKKLLCLLTCLFLVSCGGEKTASISSGTSKDTTSVKMTAESVFSQMSKGNYKEGELLVKFKADAVSSSSMKVHKAAGASVVKRYALVKNLERIRLPEGLSVKDAIVQYMSDPSVEYAEPNYMRCASAVPNDTLFGNQWALRNTGSYAYGTAGADIKAEQAWDVCTGSREITVAVLDSGIDYNHQDLAANIWRNPDDSNCASADDNDHNGFRGDCRGWNFVDDNNDPMDDLGHGTHVAGIIGAAGNNQLGIAGVMWNVQLMPVKIFDASSARSGSCSSVFVSDEIDGIEYAVHNGARVINASFHGEGYCASERSAISSANDHNVLFIAAAGNGGDDLIGDNNDLTPFYPASYDLPNVISVAATDQDDRRASFSNFGVNTVHVAAPGVYVLSTITQNAFADKDFNSGTSMAAPHVSGLAGLLFAYYYDFPLSSIRSMIFTYVDWLPNLNGWIMTGGRINAFKALSSLWMPSAFHASPVSSSEISLTWTNRATAATGYDIERTTGGAYSKIQTLGPASTSFSSTGLADGTWYSYKIRPFNNFGKTPDHSDNEASAVTPLNPPTSLRTTAVSDSQVRLAWNDSSSSESGYKIERKVFNEDFKQVGQVGQNVTSFTDSTVNHGAQYRYRVKAFNAAAGDSASSNEISVKAQSSGGSGGGGGGCSIGARQNTATAVADMTMMFLPLLFIFIARRKK